MGYPLFKSKHEKNFLEKDVLTRKFSPTISSCYCTMFYGTIAFNIFSEEFSPIAGSSSSSSEVNCFALSVMKFISIGALMKNRYSACTVDNGHMKILQKIRMIVAIFCCDCTLCNFDSVRYLECCILFVNVVIICLFKSNVFLCHNCSIWLYNYL